MEVILSTPCVIPSHKCETKLFSPSQIKFCKECSVFLGNNHSNIEINNEDCNENDEREIQKKCLKYYRTSYNQNIQRNKIDHEKNLEHMLRKQHENRFYNQEASHLMVRPKIIEFMKKIHEKFKKGSEIYHKAIVFMDSVFSRHQVAYDKIEIIVLLCLHISSKFDESFSNYDPDKSFFKYAQKSYSFNEIINLEKQLVKILEFQLDIQSPYHFLNFFNNKGVICDRDIYDLINIYSGNQNNNFEKINEENSPDNLKDLTQKSLLKKKIINYLQNVEIELNGKKNTDIKLNFTEKNILDYLDIFENAKSLKQSKNNKINFSKIKNIQIENNKVFHVLKECYLNPLWSLFIEFLFTKLNPINENNIINPNVLADKNNLFTIENLEKLDLNLSEILNTNINQITEEKNNENFLNETQIEIDQENVNPINPDTSINPKKNYISFLSNNSIKQFSNKTSIVIDPKNIFLKENENCTKIEPISFENLSKKISINLFDLDFSDFNFTISSNIETITRLLNCLRFNLEFLPVGLVEVCCSNFETIFETLLKTSCEVYSLNKFTSVAVAVSILFISRKLMNFPNVWTEDLKVLTGLTENDIEGCVEHILNNPIMYKLINSMKKNFEFDEQETVYDNKKIISFKNILKMYRTKAQKVISDFKNFECIIKSQILFKHFYQELLKKNKSKKQFGNSFNLFSGVSMDQNFSESNLKNFKSKEAEYVDRNDKILQLELDKENIIS